MTFDMFVDKYVPELATMEMKNPIRVMIRTGLYSKLVEAEREFFKDRYTLVDGGIFTVKPWEPLAEIEQKLFPNEENLFFTETRFHKRSDGYYCLVRDISK